MSNHIHNKHKKWNFLYIIAVIYFLYCTCGNDNSSKKCIKVDLLSIKKEVCRDSRIRYELDIEIINNTPYTTWTYTANDSILIPGIRSIDLPSRIYFSYSYDMVLNGRYTPLYPKSRHVKKVEFFCSNYYEKSIETQTSIRPHFLFKDSINHINDFCASEIYYDSLANIYWPTYYIINKVSKDKNSSSSKK